MKKLKTRGRRFISLILMLLMLTTVMYTPLSVSAAENGGLFGTGSGNNYYYRGPGQSSNTYVSSVEQAWNAVTSQGGTVGILADATTSSALTVPENKNILLELNGHKLDRGLINSSSSTENGNVIKVSDGGGLTVYGGTRDVSKPSCSSSVSVWNNCGYRNSGYKKTITVKDKGVITGGYTSGDGGGISVGKNASVMLNYVAVVGNRAVNGGGINTLGNSAIIRLYNSSVSYNYAMVNGGGISIKRDSTQFDDTGDNCKLDSLSDVESNEISYNYAANGGGICVTNEKTKISDFKIEGNYAFVNGGGIYISDNKGANVINCIVKNNKCSCVGGGIYNSGSTYADRCNTYENITVTDNKAEDCGGAIYNVDGVDIALIGVCVIKSSLSDGGSLYLNNAATHTEYLYQAPHADPALVKDTPQEAYYCTAKERTGFIVSSGLADGSEVYVSLSPNRSCGNMDYKNRITKIASGEKETYLHSDTDDRYCKLVPNGLGNSWSVKNGEASDGLSGYPWTKSHQPYVILAEGQKPTKPAVNCTSKKMTQVSGTNYNSEPVYRGLFTYSATDNIRAVDTDRDAVFYYSDGYFKDNAKTYNEHLATLSVCMAACAQDSAEGGMGEELNYVFKGRNIRQMMLDMGCKNEDIFMSDSYAQKPKTDSIGYCIARKKLSNGDDLVIIAVRGGYYESEWATNFELGTEGEHAGFSRNATKVFAGLEQFLQKMNISGSSSTTKFWIAGYSRAGATSNLTAKRIVDKYDTGGNRTFAYPIEPPKGGMESEKKSGSNYDCIHNVLNYLDIVPWVAPSQMGGFIRYGNDHFVPGTAVGQTTYSGEVGTKTYNNQGFGEGVPRDNTTLPVGCEEYNAQKLKMIQQLQCLDQQKGYNDYFTIATINGNVTDLGDLMDLAYTALFKDSVRIIRTMDKDTTPEEWLPAFFNRFVNYAFSHSGEGAQAVRNEYANNRDTQAAPHDDSLPLDWYYYDENGNRVNLLNQTPTYQESLMFWLWLAMGTDDIKRLGDGVSKVDLASMSTSLLISTIANAYDYINEDITYSYTSFDTSVFLPVWNHFLSPALNEAGFTLTEMATIQEYTYRALKLIIRYAKRDFNDHNIEDIGTLVYNVVMNGTLIANHDPEIAMSWIRSFDSYYDSEYDTVKYTGNYTPKDPVVEVTNATTGITTRYNAGQNIHLGANDKISFAPSDNSYSRDEDTYYYCVRPANLVGKEDSWSLVFGFYKKDEKYTWHYLNGSFTPSEIDPSEIQDGLTSLPDTYVISVVSLRDKNLSNGKTIYDYPNRLEPQSSLVSTFLFDTKQFNYIYNESDHTAMLTGYYGSASNVTIPSTCTKGGVTYSVTNLYGGFYGNTTLQSVTIPNSITSIGSLAFGNCTSLTSITIPSSVKSIGYAAFSGCTKLKTLITDGNNSLDYSSSSLKSLITDLQVTGTKIRDSAFLGFTALKNVTIPSTVKSIGGAAFSDCTNLSSVTINNGVEKIGEIAFMNCTSLASITLPSSVKSLGTDVFKGCTKLKSLTTDGSNRLDYSSLKDKITTLNVTGTKITDDAFFRFTALTSVTIPNTVTSIGTGAFDCCTSLTSVTIPDSITKISGAAFADCTKLSSVTIPSSVTSIDELAFSNCPALTSVTLPNSVTRIGAYAFSDCSNLTAINIPASVTSIDEYAFYGCTKLTDITIPETVTNIGTGAFKNCSQSFKIHGYAPSEAQYYSRRDKLTFVADNDYTFSSPVDGKVSITKYNGTASSVTLPATDGKGHTVTSVGYKAFMSCKALTSVTIPSGYTAIGDSAFANCTALATVTIQGNTLKTIDEGAFHGCSALTSVTVPSGVTTIGDSAFEECTSLTTASLPNSVTKIGDFAFYGCTKLSSVNIPTALTTIGESAFEGCKEITSITLPSTLTKMGAYAFNGCAKLTGVTFPNGLATIPNYAFQGCSKLTSVVFSESVKTIGAFAFNACTSLTNVSIPQTVTSVQSGAFSGCGSGFTIRGYSPSEAQNYAKANSIPFVVLNEYVFSSPSSGNVSLTAYNGNATTLTVPNQDSYGYNVTGIGNNAFKNNSMLTSVVIPNNVTTIGSRAFCNCPSLSTITLSSNLTSIGESAFKYSGITSVTIPASVTSVGADAFKGCDKLMSVLVSSRTTSFNATAFADCDPEMEIACYNPSTAFTFAKAHNIKYKIINEFSFSSPVNNTVSVTGYSGQATELIIPSKDPNGNTVTAIGDNALKNNTTIISVTIPSSVTSIGLKAFLNCTNLESVTIPDSVQNINNFAFYNCSNLSNVNIPDGVISIGESAFEKCSSLEEITFPDSLTTLGKNSFYKTGLKEITIPGTITSMGMGAFYGSALESVTIEDGITSLSYGLFSDCENLIEVKLPDSITEIDEFVFSNTNLQSVKLPGNLTTLGGNAFSYCASLQDVNIPNTITSMGRGSFHSCTSLKSITLRGSFKEIEYNFFYGCTNLEEVIIPASVTEISDHAFYGCSKLNNVVLPDGLQYIGDSAFEGCTALNSISLTSTQSIGKSAFKGCTSLPSIVIPSNCYWGPLNNAFEGCTSLESVQLLSGVQNIGYQAFKGCTKLNGVAIPDSVTSIDNTAFEGCNNVTISGSDPSYAKTYATNHNIPFVTGNLSDYTFVSDGDGGSLVSGYTGKKTDITLPTKDLSGNTVTGVYNEAFRGNKNITSVTIPSGYTDIYPLAFYKCYGLRSVTIPNSVTEIGPSAFAGCINLSSVTLGTGIKKISQTVFHSCYNLSSITIPSTVTEIKDGAFGYCKALASVTFSGSNLTTVGSSVFAYCTSLKTISFPSSTSSFGDSVFEHSGLTQLATIPNSSVNKISNSMYAYTPITAVSLPSNIKTIEDSAFYKCDRLKTLNLNSVQTIGVSAFGDCRSLENFTIPSSVKTIGGSAFRYCGSLTNITVPSTVTEIGSSAFSDCYKLYSVMSWSSIISDYEFYNCSGLVILTIDYSVTAIGEGAFCNCEELWTLNILPSGLKTIGQNAFKNSGIEYIEIPSGVTTINSGAFADCKGMKSITVDGTSTSFNGNVFSGSDPVIFGYNSSNAKTHATTYNKKFVALDGFTFGGYYYGVTKYTGSAEYVSIPHIFNGREVHMIANEAFKGNTHIKTVELPDHISRIEYSAFEGCTNLTSITFSDNCDWVESDAFKGCTSLTSISIPFSPSPSCFEGCTSLTSVVFKNDINPDYISQICDSAFKGCSALTDISIPETVRYIDDHAFDGCSALTSAVIPNRISRLGTYAFANCINLKSFSVPDGLTAIPNSLCENCTSLESLKLPNSVTSIGNSSFKGCSSLSAIKISNVTDIGNNAFDGCSSIKSLELSSSLNSLGTYAFANCSNLESINIPSGITAINEGVFDHCGSLKSVTLPDTVTTIDKNAFNYCTELESIKIPDNVTLLGSSAFEHCSKLANVNFGSSSKLITINSRVFNACPLLKKFEIPDSVRYIGNAAFADGCGVEHITIPTGVTSIGTWMFSGAYSLKSIDIQCNMTSIPDGFFNAASSLESIIIPENVTSIGTDAFKGCTALTDITIYDTVTSIGDRAFANCASGFTIYGYNPSAAKTYANNNNINFVDLNGFIYSEPEEGTVEITGYIGSATSLVIPPEHPRGESVEAIDEEAFKDNTKITSVRIPSGVNSLAADAFDGCTKLTTLTTDGRNDLDYSSLEGKITTLNVTGTRVDESVFAGFTNLETVTINGTVKSINNNAFDGCTSLTDVNIPKGVTSLGKESFKGCSSLVELTIPESVTAIDTDAFKGCTKLETVTISGEHGLSSSGISNLSDGDIENLNVTGDTIKSEAFENFTSVETVTISASVDTIGNEAFNGCTKLENVTIGDSEIIVGNNAFNNCGDITINTPGEGIGTMRAAEGSLFKRSTGSTIHILNGNYSEDVSAYVTGNKIVGKTTEDGVDTYTVYSPTTEDMAVESDNRVFNLPTGKNVVLERMDLIGVQLRDNNPLEGESLRFLAAVRTDLLRNAKDYGFVLARSSGDGATDRLRTNNPNILATSSKCKVVSLVNTSNELADDAHSSEDLDTGAYKYLSVAITGIPEDGAVAAKFYIQRQDGTYIYTDYFCIATLAIVRG